MFTADLQKHRISLSSLVGQRRADETIRKLTERKEMALRDATNSCRYPAAEIDNATLNKYYADNVPVDKEKTTKIREEVLSHLDAILDYVNSQDKHYGKKGVRVGSSTQGLNVDRKGDVDYSVVFMLNPWEGEEHPSNTLHWNYSQPIGIPRYYGFEDPTQNGTVSLSENLKIVQAYNSLPHPEPGYIRIGMNSITPGLEVFVRNGDLIPFLVKREFRRLLMEASKKLGVNGDIKLSRFSHGPAQILQTEVKTSDGETHPVSIDLAVVIRARLPFRPDMYWPVTSAYWPAQDKIKSIETKGINVVANKPFDWQLSFAELEKELVREIDSDNGCRKKVHRIMKSVYYTVCKEDAALSSYMLKNVWFLEMEKYPNPESWQQKCLAERYCRCLESLCTYVNTGHLPQFFDRRINLLKTDKIGQIRNDVKNILSFQFNTVDQRKRPANGPSGSQPFKKPMATVPNMHNMAYFSTLQRR